MELTISASPFELAGLRRAARDALGELPTQVADELLLALDEAATNAILHGSGGGDPVEVAVRVGDAWVEASVLDHGPAEPPRPSSTTDRLSAGGWGLWLLCCLVDEVRLERVERGTRVTLRRRIRPQSAVTGVGAAPVGSLHVRLTPGSADRQHPAAKVRWPTEEPPVARDPAEIAGTQRELARLDLVELGQQAGWSLTTPQRSRRCVGFAVCGRGPMASNGRATWPGRSLWGSRRSPAWPATPLLPGQCLQ